jgi:SAM-dependent methyltransferase
MSVITRFRDRLTENGAAGLASTFADPLRRGLSALSPRRYRRRRAEGSLDLDGDNWREGGRDQSTTLVGFAYMIQRLPIDPIEYTFVDVGSGKGRAVFLAAEFDFPRIIGVEQSPTLHGVAVANLKQVQAGGSTSNIELVCADATTYPLPAEPMVLYMYDPFGGSMLECFFEHVSASLDAHFRDVIIVYNDPTGEAHLSSMAWFERIDSGVGYVVYRSRRLAA